MDARDAQLSQQLIAGREGDGRAYQLFLTSVALYVRVALRGRVEAAQVEDVVQEVLLAVHQARHTWREGKPVMPWLNGILRYKTADYFRTLYRVRDVETHEDHAYESFAVQGTIIDEKKDLMYLMKKLTPRQRTLLVLTKVEGHTIIEAARQLGMTPTAAKVALHRLIKILRTQGKA